MRPLINSLCPANVLFERKATSYEHWCLFAVVGLLTYTSPNQSHHQNAAESKEQHAKLRGAAES